MKILYIIIIIWIAAMLLILVGFRLGRKSTEKIPITNPDDFPEENTDKEMELLKNIVSQVCNYAVENNLPPTLTVETAAINMLTLCSVANLDDWHRSEV